ncbi:dienelactone hydrolase family protein [Streptomyces sp. NPDC050145]|uniref:dienelactone hydrolase family protein n=1 Tax=Streptomyces sp. NPDC050145 TaxID=3365602 RepID=UPI0037A15CF4
MTHADDLDSEARTPDIADPAVLTETTDLPVPGAPTRMTTYLARPAEPGDHPVVLLGGELWGLNDDIRDVARQVAALGHVAVVPNLYHRTDPASRDGFARSDANRAHAFDLVGRLTRDEVEADFRAAADHARPHAGAAERTGILGFSLGGHLAYFAATRLRLAAAAIYYPGWLATSGTALSRPAPLLDDTGRIAEHGTRVALFYAGRDHIIDAAQVEAARTALTEAGVRHDITVHEEAPHAFFFPGHDTYDKVAADLSWERVADLFRTELRHGNG